MRSIVKIVYPGKKLKLATEKGYESLKLMERELDLEVKDERRCVGYHSEKGKMTVCEEFRDIESGDQCPECRRKDVYTGWRHGESSPDHDASYSVYLALCGSHVKVGVARTSRLENRWREQGADYATEIESGLGGEEALEVEKQISDRGVSERVRKEQKLEEADSRKLRQEMEELGYDSGIETVYANGLRASKLVRTGPMPSPIETVKGQIVSDGKLAMAMTSGKVLIGREQKELGAF